MVHGSAVVGGGSLAWRGRVPPWISTRLRGVISVNRASWPASLFGVCSPVEAGMVWRGVGRGSVAFSLTHPPGIYCTTAYILSPRALYSI